MTNTKGFAFALALTVLMSLASLQAQTPTLSTVNITPDAEKVRVSALGDVTGLRLEVTDEAGEIVFESGQVSAQTLDWNMRDSGGERVSPGTYTVTVTFRMPSGKLRKRVEQVTVTEAVTSGDDKGQRDAQTASAPPSPNAVDTITGEGTTGKLAKFTGPNSIDDSIISESVGKIGINNSAPTHALTINGGPSWTSNGWGGSLALPHGGAIGWATNAGGQRRGIGHSTNGLYFFRTASDPGTNASPALYDMFISDQGNVGIGTTSPGRRLHLFGRDSVLTLQTTAANLWSATDYVTNARSWHTGVGGSQVPNDVKGKYYIFDATTGQFRMVFDTNGNVGIGTTAPTYKLHVDGGSLTAMYGRSTNGAGVFGISTNDTGVAGNSTNGAGVAGNSSKGGIGVYGGSNSGVGVRGYSSTGYAGYFEGDVQVDRTLTAFGNVCAANISCTSDARLKQGITNLNYGLNQVLRLRPVSWHWKTEPQGKLQLGLVAQEVESVMPELVLREADASKPLGLNYLALLPVAVKAIQEQQQQIKQLQELVTRQQAQFLRQQAQLNQVKRTIRKGRTVTRRARR